MYFVVSDVSRPSSTLVISVWDTPSVSNLTVRSVRSSSSSMVPALLGFWPNAVLSRRIRKGTTIIEYLGERVSHKKADARYEDKDPHDNHTFLFTVDAKTVIDAGVNGNEARQLGQIISASCDYH